MTDDEMVGWHHRLNGLEIGQTLGDSEGQGSLPCCSPCCPRFRQDLVSKWQHIKKISSNPSLSIILTIYRFSSL